MVEWPPRVERESSTEAFLEREKMCRPREGEEEKLVLEGDDGEGIISCDFLFFFHFVLCKI